MTRDGIRRHRFAVTLAVAAALLFAAIQLVPRLDVGRAHSPMPVIETDPTPIAPPEVTG